MLEKNPATDAVMNTEGIESDLKSKNPYIRCFQCRTGLLVDESIVESFKDKFVFGMEKSGLDADPGGVQFWTPPEEEEDI